MTTQIKTILPAEASAKAGCLHPEALVKGWRKVKLGEAVEIIDGDRGKNYPKKEEFLNNSYCVFLDAKNVSGTKFDFISAQFITKEKHNLMRKGQLQRNDFVLTTRGTVGNIAYYDADIPYGCMRINSGMVVLRPKRDVVTDDFFYSFLISNAFREQVESLKTGSAQPQLPIRDLKLFEVLLPPLSDQKRIAEILSAFDDKIELNNKISRTLEQMAQEIFKEWFVNFRFPGHEKVKMVDSELGKIPEGWKIKNVLEVLKRIPVGQKYDNKTSSPTGKVPILDQSQSGYVGYHNDEPGVIASIDEPVSVFTNHTCNYRLMTRPFSAIQNVLPYIGINGYPTLFVHYLTRGKITMQEYKGHWPEFEQQKFLVPPPDFAVEFASYAKSMVQKIVEAEKENQKLAALRDLLLPKLMSGEIEIKE